jgi:hypothetical protein
MGAPSIKPTAARTTRPDLKVLFVIGYAENAAIANGFLNPGMQGHRQALRDDGGGRPVRPQDLPRYS